MHPLAEQVQHMAHALNGAIAEAVQADRPIGHPVETDAAHLRQLRIDSLVGTPAAIKECRIRKAQAQAAALCNASSMEAFLQAYDFLKDAREQIDRDGYCLECGKVLVGEVICVRCGRDNSPADAEGEE